MTIIIFMNLSGIDLNLLLMFDAIMHERHVTRAGAKIGMSQPAMSNALNRLRHLLKDELFVRSSDGMRPTVRALELAAPVRGALENLETALDPVAFDRALQHWNQTHGEADESLAIDGKTMCNAIDEQGRQTHIMSVVGHRTNSCYTQKKSVPYR